MLPRERVLLVRTTDPSRAVTAVKLWRFNTLYVNWYRGVVALPA